MKKRTSFFTGLILIIAASLLQAQKPIKNEISTAPLSPIFRHLQLIYERQIDSTFNIGLQGRYYYAAPPTDYDSIKSHGGDVTLFAKLMAGKKPDGIYVLLGATAGKYNIAAGYGHIGQGWFGDVEVITVTEEKSFFTYGGKLTVGYKLLISRFSMDFSTGLKFLVLPSEVKDPPNHERLLNAWGKYSWTDIPSPGSILSLGITAGYRF